MQDLQPVEYTVIDTGDGVAKRGLLSNQVAISDIFSGILLEGDRMEIRLPEGSKITGSSGGAAIDGCAVIWNGQDASNVYAWGFVLRK